MRSTQVTFGMPSDRERAFLESYVVDAWERFEDHAAVESAWFWRFGHASRHDPVELEDGTTLDDGGVVLVVNGDPDPTPAIDAERERWPAHEADGRLGTWEVKGFRPAYENARAKLVENFGAEGGALAYRLRPIASRTTVAKLETFEEDLPAVGESTEANPLPVGDWALIHFLMKQAGHDWYEEIDACRRAIRNRLGSLREFHGPDAAARELDAVVDELEELREELSADGS